MTFADQIHTFYDGKPHPETSSSASFKSIDPSTGHPLATIYTTTADQLNAAVKSGQDAFAGWSRTPPAARARVLLKAATLLRERNDALAHTETLDTGKAWSETSTVDIVTGADVLEYYAYHVASGGLDGQSTVLRPGPSGAEIRTTHEPLGVCAGIGAWNYPIQIALWKSAACLAAGNCMVYKPSEVTPLHGNALAQIYIEAGLPPGVFNVVYGDSVVGAPLVAHAGIAKVSFTGQVSTGSIVAREAAAAMKSVTMELGGKSPLLVLPDADVNDAADTAMVANFFSTGQVCTNGTRVFVPDNLLPEFERAIVAKCREGIRMGLPMDDSTNFGPLVSDPHRRKVEAYIKHGKEVDRAKVLYDGSKDAQSKRPTPDGYWVPPVVFTNCTDSMRVVREEIFGPVMCILPYSAKGREQDDWLPELIRRANDTPMGLAAGVVATDVGLAAYVIHQVDAGITWINTWGESPAEMPVGGWKLSGVGVENGHEGIRAYTRTKSTLVQLGSGACAGVFAKL